MDPAKQKQTKKGYYCFHFSDKETEAVYKLGLSQESKSKHRFFEPLSFEMEMERRWGKTLNSSLLPAATL